MPKKNNSSKNTKNALKKYKKTWGGKRAPFFLHDSYDFNPPLCQGFCLNLGSKPKLQAAAQPAAAAPAPRAASLFLTSYVVPLLLSILGSKFSKAFILAVF